MILQSLADYYQRLVDDPEEDIALPGFSEAKISFALELSLDGELVDVIDLRTIKGKKNLRRTMRVPGAVAGKTSGIKPNFLWENTGYVLGADKKGKPERAMKTFLAFRQLAHEIGDGIDDPGMKAVLAFLDAWSPDKAPEIPEWEEIAGENVVFLLAGEKKWVHESKEVREAWLRHYGQSQDGETAQCLITGKVLPIARIHTMIENVWGTNQNRGAIVSFNKDKTAFTSFGKDQNFNAPVSSEAAFAYTTALNRLLGQESRQRIQIGDASVVFWSEKQSPVVKLFGSALGGADQAQDTSLNQELALFLKSFKQGLPFDVNPENPFFILGLSPNASRISVRFWLQSTVGQMEKRLGEHLGDLEFGFGTEDTTPKSVNQLMLETVSKRIKENRTGKVSSKLSGEVTRSVMTGSQYPRTLLTCLISVIRSDQTINHDRASLVKAYLCRLYRLSDTYRNDPTSMEVTVSLDIESKNPAYRLGRLFAVLEAIQISALGRGLNTTIRDSYLSSASSAPRATFPLLLRLSANHLKKVRSDKPGWAYKLDESQTDIINGIEIAKYPATLNLEEQGLFFLGYYHQKAHGPAKDKSDQDQSDSAAETKED
ncbi:hypothetical protein AAU61_01600 [Desulfocarbo indianensis]|nr:hypothetical protein AAU61_01600 [Desulfocarbo indianensis]